MTNPQNIGESPAEPESVPTNGTVPEVAQPEQSHHQRVEEVPSEGTPPPDQFSSIQPGTAEPAASESQSTATPDSGAAGTAPTIVAVETTPTVPPIIGALTTEPEISFRAAMQIAGMTSIKLGDSELLYAESWLPNADEWFDRLRKDIPWSPEQVMMFGKDLVLRRETCNYGADYDYNPKAKPAVEWGGPVAELKTMLEGFTGRVFTQCACNLYPDGETGIGLHHDKRHPLLVASISFGAVRAVGFAPKGGKLDRSLPIVPLASGSLLLFSDAINENFKHTIIEDSSVLGPRISVTFREFAAEEDTATTGTVPEVATAKNGSDHKRGEKPCATCSTPTTRYIVSVDESGKQIRTYFCDSHEPASVKQRLWQTSHFNVGSGVCWQNTEYILQQFNDDDEKSIRLLDPTTGETANVSPIKDGKIVGLSLVDKTKDNANKRLIEAFSQSKITACPLTLVQLANDMQAKVFTPVKAIASAVIIAQHKGHGRIKEILVANAALIGWAREEFGAQGRRVPVPGAPSYGEWLEASLTVELPDGETMLACSDRYVRKVMASIDKQLEGLMKEQLELRTEPKPSGSAKRKGSPAPPDVPEKEQEIYVKQLAKMTDCLLGNGDYKIASVQDRFKQAQSMAESVEEALLDGDTERFKPQPAKQSAAGLFEFFSKEHEAAMDRVFMLDTDAEIKTAIQQFAQALADIYCPSEKKAVVTVKFVGEKHAA